MLCRLPGRHCRRINGEVQASGSLGEAIATQVVAQQHELFMLFDSISVAPYYVHPRLHFGNTDTRQCYLAMTDMLSVAPAGAYSALLHGNVVPHTMAWLCALLELHSIKQTTRFQRDIAAVFVFIAGLLERLDRQLVPSLLTADCNTTQINPYAGQLHTATPLLLRPQHVRLIPQVLETGPHLTWLMEDPALLAYEEVVAVLRALAWESPRFSHELLQAVLFFIQSSLIMEEEEGVWDVVMNQVTCLLLATKDSLFEQRLTFFIQFPPANQSGRLHGLHAFLAAVQKPLLQLASWWCIIQLSNHCRPIQQQLAAWMQANEQTARAMFVISAEQSEQQVDPLYQEAIVEKYRDVFMFLSCQPIIASEQGAGADDDDDDDEVLVADEP